MCKHSLNCDSTKFYSGPRCALTASPLPRCPIQDYAVSTAHIVPSFMSLWAGPSSYYNLSRYSFSEDACAWWNSSIILLRNRGEHKTEWQWNTNPTRNLRAICWQLEHFGKKLKKDISIYCMTHPICNTKLGYICTSALIGSYAFENAYEQVFTQKFWKCDGVSRYQIYCRAVCH